jgi:uncharacterized protein YegJ (DUF2314 family)
MSRTAFAALAGLLLSLSTPFIVATAYTMSVRSGDLQVIAAIEKARSTLPQFLRTVEHPKLSQNSFLVRVAFLEGEKVEHIWIADLDLSGNTPQGVIAEKPRIKRLRFMEWVSFDPDDITDWMYIEDGRLIGGYTTRLLQEHLSPEERKQLDTSAPYKF